MNTGTVGPGGEDLSSSLAKISNINNVYLVYGTLQTYITAVIDINNIQSKTTQLMIFLRCILTLLRSTTCFGSSYEPSFITHTTLHDYNTL